MSTLVLIVALGALVYSFRVAWVCQKRHETDQRWLNSIFQQSDTNRNDLDRLKGRNLELIARISAAQRDQGKLKAAHERDLREVAALSREVGCLRHVIGEDGETLNILRELADEAKTSAQNAHVRLYIARALASLRKRKK